MRPQGTDTGTTSAYHFEYHNVDKVEWLKLTSSNK